MPFDAAQEWISRLEAFDFGKQLHDTVNKYADQLSDLQLEQWYEGRDKDGEYIRPFYSEDPYFESPKQAKAYAAWKQRITPNPKRPEDVPNLIINGYFYSTIKPKITGDIFTIFSSDHDLGDKVLDDHPNAAGLSPEKRLVFAETFTMPDLRFDLFEQTGLIITSQ